MSSILESIKYHRAQAQEQLQYTQAWYTHMKKAADFTKVWRQENNLRSVQ